MGQEATRGAPGTAGRRPCADKWRIASAAAALIAAVLSIYGQTWRFGFLGYDDGMYVTQNPMVSGGFSREGIAWSFGFHAGNWHPLTWFSHMLDAQLFGGWAGGHHLVNVAFHAANAVLVLTLLRRMTGEFWKSAAVAALFAVHPLRVESVAWVSERKDVLAAFFWLLTMAAYLRHARRPSAGRYLAVLALFAFGVAAKPMLVGLPAALLLLDWWPLGRLGPRAALAGGAAAGRVSVVVEKLPLFALAAAASIATWEAQTAGIVRLVRPELPTRAANAAISTALYLRDFLWPANLAVLYPYPLAGFPPVHTAAAVAVLTVATATAVLARRRRPYLLAGWLWSLLTLLPVIGLVQVGAQTRADRYTYLPLLGVTVALVWLVADVGPIGGAARRTRALLGAAAIASLAAASTIQTARWSDTLTLLQHTLRTTTGNYPIMNIVGAELVAARRCGEAVPVLEETVRLKPDFDDAHYNLGNAYYCLGRYEEALPHYARTLGRIRRVPDIRSNLGYTNLRLKRFEEAARHFRDLLRDDPGSAEARVGLAIALDGLRARGAGGGGGTPSGR